MKPHHFQHSDLSKQAVSWKIQQRSVQFPWGIFNIGVEEGLFSGNKIDLHDLEAIFPDGTWVKKGVNTIIRPAQFTSNSVGKEPFMIYLGVKKMMLNQTNVTHASKDSVASEWDKRFICFLQGADVVNLYESDVPSNIQTIQHVVRVLTEDEIGDVTDYIIMPVFSLIRDKSGKIEININYIPPLLQISASPLIKKVVASVYRNITRSIDQLEAFKMRDIDGSNASPEDVMAYMTPTIIKYRFALQVLSRYLMEVRVLSKEPSTRPWDMLYVLQCLVAELTAFTAKVSILSADKEDHALSFLYDHLDSSSAFLQADKVIKTLLDQIVISEELNISMTKENEESFSVIMPESFFKLNNRFYMVIITREENARWIEEFKNFARIAASSKIQEIVDRSLPGLTVSYVRDTPPGLPARQSAYYFLIDQTGSIWQDVYNSRTMALIWDGAPEDLKIDISIMES